MDPSKQEVVDRLLSLFEGGPEQCPAGVVDIVSRRYGSIVYVESVDRYSDGLGRLVMFENYFKNMEPTLYLFGKDMHSARWEEIKSTCYRRGITLMRDDIDYEILRRKREEENTMSIYELVASRKIVREIETSETLDDYQVQRAERMIRMDMFHRYEKKVHDTAVELSHSDHALCAGFTRINDTLHRFIDEIEEIYERDGAAEDIAAQFISSSIRLKKDAKTPLFNYLEVFTEWFEERSFRLSSSAIRRAAWALLSSKGCARIKSSDGPIIVGMELKNPFDHEPK